MYLLLWAFLTIGSMGRPLEKHTYYSSPSMLSLTPSVIQVSAICTANTASLKEMYALEIYLALLSF